MGDGEAPHLNTAQPGYYNRGWNDPPPSSSNVIASIPRTRPGTQRYSGTALLGATNNNTGKVLSVGDGPPALEPPLSNGAAVKDTTKTERETTDSRPQMTSEEMVEVVTSSLAALSSNGTVTERIQKDLQKRLGVLVEAIKADKLSATLQLLTQTLLTALREKDYDTAMDAQLKVVVNCSSEASKWTTAMKKMITILKG